MQKNVINCIWISEGVITRRLIFVNWPTRSKILTKLNGIKENFGIIMEWKMSSTIQMLNLILLWENELVKSTKNVDNSFRRKNKTWSQNKFDYTEKTCSGQRISHWIWNLMKSDEGTVIVRDRQGRKVILGRVLPWNVVKHREGGYFFFQKERKDGQCSMQPQEKKIQRGHRILNTALFIILWTWIGKNMDWLGLNALWK